MSKYFPNQLINDLKVSNSISVANNRNNKEIMRKDILKQVFGISFSYYLADEKYPHAIVDFTTEQVPTILLSEMNVTDRILNYEKTLIDLRGKNKDRQLEPLLIKNGGALYYQNNSLNFIQTAKNMVIYNNEPSYQYIEEFIAFGISTERSDKPFTFISKRRTIPNKEDSASFSDIMALFDFYHDDKEGKPRSINIIIDGEIQDKDNSKYTTVNIVLYKEKEDGFLGLIENGNYKAIAYLDDKRFEELSSIYNPFWNINESNCNNTNLSDNTLYL